MSKGQRGNKEAKKPKRAPAPAPIPARAAMPAQVAPAQNTTSPHWPKK